MRLTEATQQVIKTEVYKLLGADSQITLFGSRVDDSQKGGDIDLFIQTPQPLNNKVETECLLSARLYIKLGGRKVDVLIRDKLSEMKPIYRHAIDYGVAL